MKKRSENGFQRESLADLAAKAGVPQWSRAAGKMMVQEPATRINPQSSEGRLIAAKYVLTK